VPGGAFAEHSSYCARPPRVLFPDPAYWTGERTGIGVAAASGVAGAPAGMGPTRRVDAAAGMARTSAWLGVLDAA
jgi:hypothetical protein